jgi:hypothetical protein
MDEADDAEALLFIGRMAERKLKAGGKWPGLGRLKGLLNSSVRLYRIPQTASALV